MRRALFLLLALLPGLAHAGVGAAVPVGTCVKNNVAESCVAAAKGSTTRRTLADWMADVVSTKAAWDTAAVATQTYATTAAGLTGTAEGGYFLVPSASADESHILYREVGGVAVEQKRYPSTTAVSDIRAELPLDARRLGAKVDGITDDAAALEALAAFLDANPTVRGQLPGGAYHLSRHVYLGNASQVSVSPKATFPSGKRAIVSGEPLGHLYATPLRPWADSNKLSTWQRVPMTYEFTVAQTYAFQGLAYWGGYYYVGYDQVDGGNGRVLRYAANGVQDFGYGNQALAINHAAELAYRASDGRIYAVNGGATFPTFVYQLAADGRSITNTLDFTAMGNAGLIAIDNDRDLLVLHTAPSDTGTKTFRIIDWNDGNRVLKQWTLANVGTPQGLEVYDGVIYYYTETGKITLLDYDGQVLETWKLNFPGGESEGLALVHEFGAPSIALGYSKDGDTGSSGGTGVNRVYTLRTAESRSVWKSLSTLGSMNRTQLGNGADKDTTLQPHSFTFSLQKAGATWRFAQFSAGNHTNPAALKSTPTVSATEVRFGFNRNFWRSIAGVHASPALGSPYHVRAGFDEATNEVVVELRDASLAVVNPTSAADNTLHVTITGGLRTDTY